MRAAVFSDTHSNTAGMVDAIKRERPDVIIHLGDHDRDALSVKEKFPDIPMYSVAGNCDMAPLSPLADIVPLGPVKAYIVHGHMYDVGWGNVTGLVYAAQEAGAKIAMYGHTHRADNQEVGGVKVVNPGTAGRGREPSYAMVEVFDNGGIAVEIKEI